jgi:lipopolysaccharide export LptBFGC system permease protein LptF
MSMGRPTRGERGRRPPLAEIDSWELWQAWRRGERKRVLPWFGLLAGFCLVLAAMYSFFYFSSVLSQDNIFPIILGVIYAGFLYWVWQRISTRRVFALAIVAVMVVVSMLGFGAWFLLYLASDFDPLMAVAGTAVLGLLGLVVGLPALNRIARQQG